MTPQAVSIDIEDWEAALPKFRVSEAVLLSLINVRLARDGDLPACQIEALRHVERPGRNWAVAKFKMGTIDFSQARKKYEKIAALMVDASDGFDVDWPSTARH
jgi:hypothetical protein